MASTREKTDGFLDFDHTAQLERSADYSLLR
jgi:hypothetical protein